jgi:RHS repeat-associated protein
MATISLRISRRAALGASLLAAALALTPATAHAVGGPAPGAVSAQTVKLPSGPGSVRGLTDDAEVSAFTGQVEYAVPIELPAGIAGLTPSLSLSYAGALGNGALGVGWSLRLPAIQRSLRLGVPAFDATDTLELVGAASGELVAIAPGVYRLEGQGHGYEIVAEGDGFLVRDPDGLEYRYGVSAAARKGAAGAVAAWYLEEIRDVAGQTIAYTYRRERGEVYLDAIAWGPDHGGAPAFRADLVYEARPDAVIGYRTGARVETAERLARIDVESFGTPLRTVALGYDETFALSRLAGVTVTGGDDALPALSFTYAVPSPAVVQPVPGVDGWALGSSGTSLFDVDADGVTDLLRLRAGGHSWRRNLGGSFAPAQTITGAPGAALDNVRLLDLDGDATAEMAWQQGSQWSVYRMANRAWSDAGRWPGTSGVALDGVAITDLDGDGRMDVLAASGSAMTVRMGSDTGFAPSRRVAGIDTSRTFIYPNAANTSFPDINGDGLADVAYRAASRMYLYLGSGDGRFVHHRDVAYPWDGVVSASQIRLADLDRDGLLDAVLVRGGNVEWYRGRADGAWAPQPVALPRPPGTDASVVVALADGNGNGSEDVVWSSPDGMWIVDLAGSTSAGMLVGIDNGLGQTQSFTYQASSRLALADEVRGAPWASTLPMSIPVAVRQARALASGEPTRSTGLAVRDGVYARDERRFLGFAEAVVSRPDPADGAAAADTVRHVQRFHLGLGMDRVLRGQLVHERIEDGAGHVYRETTNDLTAATVAGLSPTEPRLRRAVTTATETRHHEGQATPLVTRIEYGVDDEGRVVEERTRGRTDLTGDESTTRRRYTAGRSAAGVRDRVCEEWLVAPATANAAETEVMHTRTLFGDDSSPVAALCDASRGWPRRAEQWLADEERWVTLEETWYDPRGNPVRTREGGIARTLEYDRHGLHTVAESVQPSASRTLRWTAEWDDVLGVATRVTDASGVTMVATYDGLARVTSVAQSGAEPYVHYRYHWSGPHPTTETFTYDGDPTTIPALPATWTATGGWRHLVAVTNSAGEALRSATRLASDRWLVSSNQRRDALGRIVEVDEAFEWTGADPALAAPPDGTPLRSMAHDGLDRIVAQTLPTGARNAYAYAAFQTVVTTDGLAPVTTTRDGAGRIVRTERTVGGITEAVDASHDTAGRITEIRIAAATPVVHRFEHDSLGRLVFASDPDIGERHLAYDDDGRLIEHTNGAGQTVTYAYDGASRLTAIDAADARFVYHYDDAVDAGTFARTAGRLAWVEEATGTAQIGYDAFGRMSRFRRSVKSGGGDRVADQTTTFAPSGLPLAVDHDGLSLALGYDAAGRATRIGDLWSLDQQDASGRVLAETFGNGVEQSYERDALGQATRVRIERPSGAAIYDATVGYTPYGAVASVTDGDGAGLDHTAAFTYDSGARLVDAVLGQGAGQFHFTYAYDGLQNMIARTATGPKALGVLAGEYRYGEQARGPRQLTSVVGAATTTFGYDTAGRMTAQGALGLDYNAFDQLVRVRGAAGGTVEHAYGYDGLRVRTRDGNGSEQVWFTRDLAEADGVRDVYIRLGDRLIARITRAPESAAGALHTGSAGLAVVGLGFVVLVGIRTRRRRAVGSAALLVTVVLTSCGPTGGSQVLALTTARTLYYHQAVGAGPSVITRDDGSVFEERRYEPFGEDIDAYREDAGVGTVGTIDHHRDANNLLNKLTDPTTGWSDHGARWMAPETGRWLTPDPPVKAPDASYLESPWNLHPYQYVGQNPVAFWDPDGNQRVRLTVTRDAAVATANERSARPAMYVPTPRISQFDLGLDDEHAQKACFPAARLMADHGGGSANDALRYFRRSGGRNGNNGGTRNFTKGPTSTVPAHALRNPTASDWALRVKAKVDSDGAIIVDPAGAGRMKDYIYKNLVQGKPALVGVDYENGGPNADGVTDHFVTVVAFDYDAQGRPYFEYQDPASGQVPTGRLYIDRTTGKLFKEGTAAPYYAVEQDYTATHARVRDDVAP